MKASEINWGAIKRFSAAEWPPGTLEHMDASVITALAAVRDSLPRDHAMTPSPVPAAHVRHIGSSRHSTQGGTRLSDATDVFMPGGWKQALAAWQAAQRVPEIGGIGFYLDKWLGSPGNITPMLHIDCRPDRLLWVCLGNQYIYLHSNPEQFFLMMARAAK